jgi:hypothetical protein
MKQIKQRIINSKNGDCLKCCVASIFELPYEEVPNFSEELDWLYALLLFLKDRFNLIPIYLQRQEPLYQKIFYIATGKSPRGEFHHAVVMCATEMVNDPHPDNSGLEKFEHIILFHPYKF